MDTAQLKKFAQEARKSLLGIAEAKLDVVLAEDSLARRESKPAIDALEGLIQEIGKEQVIEKVAYTWFNRFCALRFMDANHYNRIGIVSPVEGQTQPEILAEAKMGYYDDSVINSQTKERVDKLLNTSQDDAYKLLLVSYCNFLNKQLPFMFERINDYTELLMPDDLLSENSVLSQTVAVLDKDTCKDVEVIGWLYQYYISEKKDEVFADLKKGKKITKENIPAATQIFTPKWIVSYMVENSVGKLWLESHPDKNLQDKFKYYLESAEQEPEVAAKIEELKNKDIKPQDIKILDPACGSGHILVRAFEVLFEIYKSQGWQENEIPEMILKNNLFGLDICDRAAQLAQFAVMMKAREYDRSIFNKVKELNICSIKDTNWIDYNVAQELLKDVKDEQLAKEQIELLQNTFKDAKEYGSILDVKGFDFDFWDERIEYFSQKGQLSTYKPLIRGRLKYSIKQAKIMQQQYDCVISNPPYMGVRGMDNKLSDYVKKKYSDSKSDFFSIFMEKNYHFTKINGYTSMITQPSWLFLSSFEKLRNQILNNETVESVLHMGRGIFGIDFGSCAFTFRKTTISDYNGSYFRLHQRTFQYINPEDIENIFLNAKDNHDYMFDFASYKANSEISINEDDDENIEHKPLKIFFNTKQNGFHSIPGSPIAYWASDRVRDIFRNADELGNIAKPRQGMATTNNDLFLRSWFEINIDKIGFNIKSTEDAIKFNYKWFPYNKGGDYRKWYGNNVFIVNFENNGKTICDYIDNTPNARVKSNGRVINREFYYKPNITWSKISSGNLSMRYIDCGFIFDVAGCSIFYNDKQVLKYLLALVNSSIVKTLVGCLSPTLNYEVGQICSLPVIFSNDDNKRKYIITLVQQNIDISKDDWDSFETSWDFKIHPLLRFSNLNKGLVDGKNVNNSEPITQGDRIEDCFKKWKDYKQKQFNDLKKNEEELNEIFINIYGLKEEIDSKVDDKDITVVLADEKREIKSLISYAVGCMFGRYSLDAPGLIFAGGEFDKSNYTIFEADDDGIIPILSEHYFSDDITERFKKFVKAAFGEIIWIMLLLF